MTKLTASRRSAVLVGAVFAAIIGAQTAVASPPPPTPQRVPYSVWHQPTSSGLSAVGSWFSEPVIDEPSGRSYAFGHTFSFLEQAPGGFVALTDDALGKQVVLALFRDADLESVAIPFPWSAGHFYFPLVALVGEDHLGAWIFDQGASTWTFVGVLPVDPAVGRLSPVSTTWVAWTDHAAPCIDYPRTNSLRHPPIGVTSDGLLTVAHNVENRTVAALSAFCPVDIFVHQNGAVAYGLGHTPTVMG